ncbi:invasion associated locus B family protein [Roseomonas populi]|uniref:Invasion associated locus B family protein n=1 Tax=Roseomonas populi TaxID=3121582 RepID=A0ABT1XAR1_9PROT|nr:invasion associated locus B family protein [Roseomonas pecuniae]MCR0984513.1 invasion associated locus B family protein [Roseomonas pecuniae]
MIRHAPALALAALAALALATPATAQRGARQAPAAEQPAQSGGQAGSQSGNSPQRLGTFGEWTAATHTEASGKVCYAFTRMEGRNNTLLTVTHRAQGRDQVSLRIGRAFPRNAEVKVDVGNNDLDFYTSGENAFARDGRATVAAFRNGRDAVAKSPAPNNRSTTETFPLSGFTAAYEAISKECPPGSSSRR